MYFLGTLEKILEGSPKIVPQVVHKEITESPKAPESKKVYDKPFVKGEYKKTYDKPYVKGEYKKTYPPKGDFKENDSKPKKKANNCYGVFVRDGDTFEAMYNQERVCFRLAGIDSPEKNQPFSDAAKEFLKSKVLRKVIYIESKGQDLYKREIVEAYEDKEMKISINKQLLQEGLATSERYKNNEGELTHNIIEHAGNKIAEFGANISDKGMWAEPTVTKVEPFKVINEESPSESSSPALQAPPKRKFPK